MERESDAAATTTRTSRIAGSVLILLSVVALCFSGDRMLRSMEKRSEWRSVSATVTQLVPRSDIHNDRTVYTACFSFRDTDGNRMITVKSKTASNPPSFRLGEKVEMLYPPGHPEEAIANTFMELYMASIVIGVIGAVMGIMGLLMRKGGGRFGSLLADERDSRTRIELGPMRMRLPGSLIGKLFSPPKSGTEPTQPQAPTPEQPPAAEAAEAPAEKSDDAPRPQA